MLFIILLSTTKKESDMKILPPSVTLIKNENLLKTVEFCARLCYKSEASITDDSYIRFCKARFAEHHYAIFEHANFVFHIGLDNKDDCLRLITVFENLYGVTYQTTYDGLFVTLNLRHIFELADEGNFQFYDMLSEEYKIFYTPDERQNLIVKHLCPCLTNVTLLTPDDVLSDVRIRHNRFMFYTVAFDCQRSVWDELARHRKNGLCCESSRYCSYNKGKFGGEITFSQPDWYNAEAEEENEKVLKADCLTAEKNYMDLIAKGFKPQDARYVLPLGYRVNCVVTASMEQWEHIIDLRTSNAAHPDIKAIMEKVEKMILGVE